MALDWGTIEVSVFREFPEVSKHQLVDSLNSAWIDLRFWSQSGRAAVYSG